jgi:twinkle protein
MITRPEEEAGITYADLDIDVRHCRTEECKTWCPKCRDTHSPGKRTQKDLSVNLARGEGKCHRCPYTFGLGKEARERGLTPRVVSTPLSRPNAPQRPRIEAERPQTEVMPPRTMPGLLHDWAVEWCGQREIPEDVMHHFGIESTERWEEFDQPTLHFPYRLDGTLVNIKHRILPKDFRQEKKALRSCFNIDAANGAETVVVAEGELDVMACHEAGFIAISPPDGAPGLIRDPVTGATTGVAEVGNKAMAFLEPRNAEILSGIKRFIIATDADMEGQKLAEWLVEHFGAERCWQVAWPEGVKDANQMLVERGTKALTDLISRARPVNPPGIYTFEDQREEAHYIHQHGLPKGLSTGWIDFDSLYTVWSGSVVVIYGVPSHGKTSWVNNLIVNLAHIHDMKFGVFSPEAGRPVMALMKYVQIANDRPLLPGYEQQMTAEELDIGIDWVRDRFFRIDAPTQGSSYTKFSIPEIVSRGEQLALRSGIGGLVIDPWNYLLPMRPDGQSDTEYVANSILQLHEFADRYQTTVFVIAHPTKQDFGQREDAEETMPKPYSIAGSAHWYNMADAILGVQRNKYTEPINQTTVKVWKNREEGVYGSLGECYFTFDERSRRFHCRSTPIPILTGTNPYPELPASLRVSPMSISQGNTTFADEPF